MSFQHSFVHCSFLRPLICSIYLSSETQWKMNVFRILELRTSRAGSLSTVQRQKYKPVTTPIKSPFSIIPVLPNLVFCQGSVAGECILDIWAATLVGQVPHYYTEEKITLSIILFFLCPLLWPFIRSIHLYSEDLFVHFYELAIFQSFHHSFFQFSIFPFPCLFCLTLF